MIRLARLSYLLTSPARRLGLVIIGCVLVVDLMWLPFSALRIGADNLAVIALIAGAFVLAGPLQRRYALPPVICNILVELYILIVFGAVGFVFSYLVIEHGWIVRDELFASIDRRLGFDWRDYTSFVLQNDVLRSASVVLYVLTPILVGITLLRLSLQSAFERASEIVAMVIVGGVLCVLVSGVAPSVGGVGYFAAASDLFLGREVIFDSAYKVTFFELRSGAGMDVFLLHPVALIAFPSYHACLGLIVILASWGTGTRGWMIVALGIGSMFSMPVQGGHHFSDVLGGLLTGALAFRSVRAFVGGSGS
jgi:hypothetical protein